MNSNSSSYSSSCQSSPESVECNIANDELEFLGKTPTLTQLKEIKDKAMREGKLGKIEIMEYEDVTDITNLKPLVDESEYCSTKYFEDQHSLQTENSLESLPMLSGTMPVAMSARLLPSEENPMISELIEKLRI